MNLLDRNHPLQIAARRGYVFAGTDSDGGSIIRISGSACARLVRAGAFTVSTGPDGNRMYRITDLGREYARLGVVPANRKR